MHNSAFSFALSIIDDGLRLYRRHATLLILNTAILLVPLGVLVGLLIAAASWAETNNWFWLVVLAIVLLVFPLSIYVIASLSLTARHLLDGRVPTLREVLLIGPLRLLGLCIFAFIDSIVMQVIYGFLAFIVVVSGYALLLAMGALIGIVNPDESLLVGIILLGVLGFVSLYGISFVFSLTSSCAVVYGMQAWLEPVPIGERISISIEMSFYQFFRNSVTWFLCALVLLAVGTASVATVGAAISLPLILALGEDSTITQAISASAWVLALMLVIPPLPIWMALIYRANRQQAIAPDFVARVAAWHTASTANRPALAVE